MLSRPSHHPNDEDLSLGTPNRKVRDGWGTDSFFGWSIVEYPPYRCGGLD